MAAFLAPSLSLSLSCSQRERERESERDKVAPLRARRARGVSWKLCIEEWPCGRVYFSCFFPHERSDIRGCERYRLRTRVTFPVSDFKHSSIRVFWKPPLRTSFKRLYRSPLIARHRSCTHTLKIYYGTIPNRLPSIPNRLSQNTQALCERGYDGLFQPVQQRTLDSLEYIFVLNFHTERALW